MITEKLDFSRKFGAKKFTYSLFTAYLRTVLRTRFAISRSCKTPVQSSGCNYTKRKIYTPKRRAAFSPKIALRSFSVISSILKRESSSA